MMARSLLYPVMSAPNSHRNRLAGETSPYLLQHAANPVDWYAWGEEAFAAARSGGKPVLLSIGYSACHWCHVMAHESFEDAETAALMNSLFINIKVDREERPDIDRIYQMAHQLLTRRGGGWPLTLFLTHDDQRPFFGGTYFPPQASRGMPAFRTVLERVGSYYREQQAELRGQSQMLVEAMARIEMPSALPQVPLTREPIELLRSQLQQRFDRHWGGFGAAPKFPHPGMLQRLLRDWRATAELEQPDLQALFMSTLTLKRMAEGGLFDHLGGGFARYSVDERWEIPHFEKMLYDNGALLSVYSEAAVATGDAAFARVAEETATFLLRDCRTPAGAFISAFDADSDGHEGRFYVWDRAEVEAELGPNEYPLFAARFGLDQPANFEGRWHLQARTGIEDLARDGRFGSVLAAELESRLEPARARLLERRNQRVWPARDDKVLTSWNALAIKGLADAARALGRDDFAEAGARALCYLMQHHWKDGRLLATSRDGEARLPAYLDDHALLLDAILQLATVRFDGRELEFARRLADTLLDRFEDSSNGGFFFTADDHEALIHRSRTFSDDAMPSGNAVAAEGLLKLGHLLGENRYLQAAERTLLAGWGALSEQPLAHAHLATALETFLAKPVIVILRGSPETTGLWRRDLQRLYQPQLSVFAIPSDAPGLPQSLAIKVPQGDITAWLCRGSVCEPPTTSLSALKEALQREA
jgi:uncharacterized protein